MGFARLYAKNVGLEGSSDNIKYLSVELPDGPERNRQGELDISQDKEEHHRILPDPIVSNPGATCGLGVGNV